MIALAVGGWVAVVLQAQSVDINPEFRRVDPFGAVVEADRGLVAREILSPALARNGFASFHIVVSVPPKRELPAVCGVESFNCLPDRLI